MNKQNRRMQVAANLCLELGKDDGRENPYNVGKEAMRVFSLVLAGECRQRVLRDVQVVSVVPEREGQLLLVTVASVNGSNQFRTHNPFGLSLSKSERVHTSTGSRRTVNNNQANRNQTQAEGDVILAALKQVQGQLRFALARAVNRKHTPELAFRYVGVMAFDKADKVGQEVVYAD